MPALRKAPNPKTPMTLSPNDLPHALHGNKRSARVPSQNRTSSRGANPIRETRTVITRQTPPTLSIFQTFVTTSPKNGSGNYRLPSQLAQSPAVR